MAKNGTKTNIAIISLLVTASMILTGLVTYAVTNTHETKDTSKAVSELKVEGCLPAREGEKAIIRIETKFDAFVVEQRAAKREILEAIKER